MDGLAFPGGVREGGVSLSAAPGTMAWLEGSGTEWRGGGEHWRDAAGGIPVKGTRKG